MKNEREISGSVEGQLLIAVPHMEDPRFRHSLVYMCSHSRSGAVGLVVNKLIEDMPFADLLEQLDIETGDKSNAIRVHFGGPVEPGRGFVLHTSDYSIDGTTGVAGGMALTATTDILRDIALGRGPAQSLLALGYSGWGPGQLDREIQDNGWLVVPADTALLFDADIDSKWQRAYAKLGVEPGALSQTSGRA
ncbi:MAG: YqgE/AlgH family protein [Reyranellaceae bacterium]